jgi:hypothetical protein
LRRKRQQKTKYKRQRAEVRIVGRVGEYRIPLSNSHAIGKMGEAEAGKHRIHGFWERKKRRLGVA